MTTTFLGIPVDGDIVRGEHKAQQKPLEDLSPLIQAVLDDDGIACFGWTQYIPYFNDGDPCEFSVGEVWAARPEDLPDAVTDDPDYFDKSSLSISYSRHLGTYDGGDWIDNPGTDTGFPRILVGATYVGPDQARYDRCQALADAIDSGAFDDVLLEAFGDHAEITVKRDGIQVEFYAHD